MNPSYFQNRSIKTRVTLFTLGIFLLSLWLLMNYASRILRTDIFVNPRGVQVLSSSKRVPVAGGLTWWMVRHQLAPMLATVKSLAVIAQSDQHPVPVTRQDDFLKWADAAMYQAKEAGGNLIRFHAANASVSA